MLQRSLLISRYDLTFERKYNLQSNNYLDEHSQKYLTLVTIIYASLKAPYSGLQLPHMEDHRTHVPSATWQ